MNDDDVELERLRLKARALDLLDELGIGGKVRDEMIADPARAIAVLERAASSAHVKNPAALAIANWKRGHGKPHGRSRLDELDETPEQPPTLSALEYAWSRARSPIGESLLSMMAFSIERNGGATAMLTAGWWWDEHYDEGGNLVERVLAANP